MNAQYHTIGYRTLKFIKNSNNADALSNETSSSLALISEEPETELRRELTPAAGRALLPPDPLQLSQIERIYQRTVTEIRLPDDDLSMQLLS